MPLSIGLLLLFVGLIYLFFSNTKKAKFYLSVSFLWFLVISYSPFSNAIIKPLESEYKAYLNVDKSLKYVMVLGSGNITNRNISSLSQLSRVSLSRLSEAIKIYNQLDDAKLITSGYTGRDKITPNAIAVRDAAIELGVSKDNIIVSEKPRDTIEEARLIKPILKDQKFILVTSAAHMPRAIRIFKAEGLNPIPAPTNFLARNDGFYEKPPMGEEILKAERALHEYVGILWHSILEKVKFYLN